MNFKITTEFKNVDKKFIKNWFTKLSYSDNPDGYKTLLKNGKLIENGFAKFGLSEDTQKVEAIKTFEINKQSE